MANSIYNFGLIFSALLPPLSTTLRSQTTEQIKYRNDKLGVIFRLTGFIKPLTRNPQTNSNPLFIEFTVVLLTLFKVNKTTELS